MGKQRNIGVPLCSSGRQYSGIHEPPCVPVRLLTPGISECHFNHAMGKDSTYQRIDLIECKRKNIGVPLRSSRRQYSDIHEPPCVPVRLLTLV